MIDAHFAVLRNGTVLHLHDVSEYLNASGKFNRRAIAIEFAGNPISDRGTVHEEAKFGRHVPTLAQIFAGRGLIQKLKFEHGLTHVFAHRQADGVGRGNCPGPHIWFNVGEFAKALGLSDGGPGFFVSRGKPIRDTWRDKVFDLTFEDIFKSALEHGLKPRLWGMQPLP